jgi:hypothetical protein
MGHSGDGGSIKFISRLILWAIISGFSIPQIADVEWALTPESADAHTLVES